MSIETLLQRLDKVKRIGPKKWQSRCPAHDDRGPSLAITETDDERLLMHCFAGCSVHEVVGALGMELSDLFPVRQITDGCKPERRPFSADDALRCLAFESKIVQLAAMETVEGQVLNDADFDRLIIAVERIDDALSVVKPDMLPQRWKDSA